MFPDISCPTISPVPNNWGISLIKTEHVTTFKILIKNIYWPDRNLIQIDKDAKIFIYRLNCHMQVQILNV